MRDEDALIVALRRTRKDRLWHPPLSLPEIEDVERRLRFELPPLLRRLYGEAGNGGVGPGLLPLTLPNEGLGSYEPETSALWYRSLRDNPPTADEVGPDDPEMPMLEWPERMLMICDWGCNIFSYVDYSQPDLPVLRNDNNVSWSVFAVEDSSLHSWLARATAGEDLFPLDWDKAERVDFPTFRRPER